MVFISFMFQHGVLAQLTWTWRNPSTPGDNISSIVWANNQFVAVTSDFGYILTSSDGVNWEHRFTEKDINYPNQYSCVIWTGSRYFVSGGLGSTRGNPIITSTDGISWAGTSRPGADINGLNYDLPELASIVWTGSTYVAVGRYKISYSAIYTSVDGINWPATDKRSGNRWNCVINTDSLIVALGDSGVIVSPDGQKWTPIPRDSRYLFKCALWTSSKNILAATNYNIVRSTDYGITWTEEAKLGDIRAFAEGDGKIVAVGDKGSCSVFDGTQWSAKSSITSNNLLCVSWTGTKFVAGGQAGTLVTSADGTTWTQLGRNPSGFIKSVVWTGTRYVAVGGDRSVSSGNIMTSSDGIDWNNQVLPANRALYSVAWSGQKLVAVGDSGYILNSINGESWSVCQPHLTGQTFNNIIWGNNQFMAIGRSGNIYTSHDGIVWTKQDPGTMNDLYSVIWTGSLYVVTGNVGCILSSPDGINWKGIVSGVTINLSNIVFNGNQYLIVTGAPVLTSSDAITWKSVTSSDIKGTNSILWDGHQYLAVGGTDPLNRTPSVYTSPDGSKWMENPLETNAMMWAVVYNGKQYLVAGDSGIVFTAPADSFTTAIQKTVDKQSGSAASQVVTVTGNRRCIALQGYGCDPVTVRMFDINGKMIRQWNGSGPEVLIPAGTLRSGRYFFQIFSPEKGIVTRAFSFVE